MLLAMLSVNMARRVAGELWLRCYSLLQCALSYCVPLLIFWQWALRRMPAMPYRVAVVLPMCARVQVPRVHTYAVVAVMAGQQCPELFPTREREHHPGCAHIRPTPYEGAIPAL
jgi:hypothetical protein